MSDSCVLLLTAPGERFTTSGLAIAARKYLDVYKYERCAQGLLCGKIVFPLTLAPSLVPVSWSGCIIPVYEGGQRFTPSTLLLEVQTPSISCPLFLLPCQFPPAPPMPLARAAIALVVPRRTGGLDQSSGAANRERADRSDG